MRREKKLRLKKDKTNLKEVLDAKKEKNNGDNYGRFQQKIKDKEKK